MNRLGILLGIGLLLSPEFYAQSQTDRERHGLMGPVRSVTSEVAILEKKAGEWAEGKRVIASEIVYEPEGKARILRGAPPTDLGATPGTAFRQLASEDSPGSKITKAYDSDGDLIEEAFYGPDGSFAGNVTFVYDSAGKVVVETYRRADGTPRAQAEYGFDSQGRAVSVKTMLFKKDGSPEQKTGTTYEYDAIGNWIKRTRWLWKPTAQSEKTTVTVTYRSIAYF